MPWKRKRAQPTNHSISLIVQNTKKRKTKMKKKPNKFVLDQEGDTKLIMISTANKTTAENTLGHDPLVEKERELVADLFGDDSKFPEAVEADSAAQEEEQLEVKVKTEAENLPASIPHDPFDIHQQDEETRRPAWVDEDDRSIKVRDVVAGMNKAKGSRGIRELSEEQYSNTVQQKFSQVTGGIPEWAQLQKPDTKQEVEEGSLMKNTGDYLSHRKSVKLDKKRIDIKREVDLNYASRTEGAIISATEFNPKHHIGLVAGFSTTVVGAASLFKVDGTHNHLIHSVKFPKFPIKYAKFFGDGGRFIAGCNQYNYFYMYDLEAAQETKIPSTLGSDGHNMKNVLVSPDGDLLVFIGKNGQLHLFDADSLSLVETLYASGMVTAGAFSSDGSRMYTHTTEGDVCIWDMHARACIHRFYDDGCIGGTSIAVSPSNQYLACGSSSGVINVYDLADVMNHSPTPVKMLSRLRTTVSAVTFNSSSEVLATVSNQMENAVKLVHLPSMTYFENFPDLGTKLKQIHSINFSPESGFLAAGNNSGRAFLYRLHHYSNY